MARTSKKLGILDSTRTSSMSWKKLAVKTIAVTMAAFPDYRAST
jgi:hypothetical protein